MTYPELPTLAAPFTFDAAGQAEVNGQDTLDDVKACVFNVAVCPLGFRDDQPAFGIPELLFQTVPIPLAPLQAAIARSEPRAELDASQTFTAPDTIAIVEAVALKETSG